MNLLFLRMRLAHLNFEMGGIRAAASSKEQRMIRNHAPNFLPNLYLYAIIYSATQGGKLRTVSNFF